MKILCMQRDQIIDIGPGAGVHGGQVMAQRNSRRDKTNKRFYYRAVLKWKKKIEVPKKKKTSKNKSDRSTRSNRKQFKKYKRKISIRSI